MQYECVKRIIWRQRTTNVDNIVFSMNFDVKFNMQLLKRSLVPIIIIHLREWNMTSVICSTVSGCSLIMRWWKSSKWWSKKKNHNKKSQQIKTNNSKYFVFLVCCLLIDRREPFAIIINITASQLWSQIRLCN